ncbi:MAG: type I DNA topoisomerase [Ruminococcaceae bacterium]|nr:type I DNA topoisomerase [Oscillospiraceae bacterium]
MANLVIVESPAKASTIKSYLGSNYKVVASKGHVRDLPKSSLGVDIENNFEAHYINIRGKGDLIKALKKDAKSANKVFLATDPDREGEAISWHLATALDLPPEKCYRVAFNEITKAAIKEAIKNPREIDEELVNSQQARRILDRIVGYKISPFLWKSVKSGLSGGRVQSVATRIIVDREAEIKAFVPQEYWTVDALLSTSENKLVKARLIGKGKGKIKLSSKADVDAVLSDIGNSAFLCTSVKKAAKTKQPTPPFTTSTMQQEASRKLNFQSQRIMRVAQELYEGVNLGAENGGVQGLITYMRTDSLRISADAQAAALELIAEKYGEGYCPSRPRVYKTKSNAQDAHEAIRPSNVKLEPATVRKYLSADQYKLYKLIWDRFVASQMASAVFDTETIEFDANGYIFRTSGYTIKFQGYMAVYEESLDEMPAQDNENVEKNEKLPVINEKDLLVRKDYDNIQHYTEAPPRFNEASLIKFMEEKGIGRPSTYTPIITTIIARNYVAREGKSLIPTTLGEVTTKLMVENFPEVVDYEFTAQMEDKLDGIARGDSTVEKVLGDFYVGFEKSLEAANESLNAGNIEVVAEETDIICEKCGSKMVVKNGRFGRFAACPNYPTCKNTKPLTKPEDEEKKEKKPQIVADFKCELCGGDMVLRSGRYGTFYACANYPKCKFTKQRVKEIGVDCPKCGAKVVSKIGRNKTVFYSCERYPDCDFSTWDMPTNEKCPNCGKMLFRKKGKDLYVCQDKDCGYKTEAPALVSTEEN